jgi:hypothetical protein
MQKLYTDASGEHQPQTGTFTLETGLLDTAVVVTGRRQDNGTIRYSVDVISTIDQKDRQVQKGQADRENAHGGDFLNLPDASAAQKGRAARARDAIRGVLPSRKSQESSSDEPTDLIF